MILTAKAQENSEVAVSLTLDISPPPRDSRSSDLLVGSGKKMVPKKFQNDA